MGFGIYVLLGLLILGVLVIIICNIKLKKDDASKEYDQMSVKELGGKFRKLNKGKMSLAFAYDPVEKRKKQAILTKMAVMPQVTDENGVEYTVGQLVSEKYYFKQFTSKDGPYIAYAIFPVKDEQISKDETEEETEKNTAEQKENITEK